MEYLNDEMDELFRKAGEHYPLKTTDSDWNGVLGRLGTQSGDESVSAAEAGGRRNKKRMFFWLLLLLPLSLISIKYFSGPEEKGIAYAGSHNSATSLKNAESNYPENVLPDSRANKATTKITHAGGVKSGPLYIITRPQMSTLKQQQAIQELQKKNAALSPAVNKEDATGEPVQVRDAAVKTERAAILLPGKDSSAPADINPVGKQTQTTSGKTTTGQTGLNQKNKNPAKVSPEKGIYLSLVAAPDFSTVKFQSVKNIGYSIGLLAGYRFSRHISLEAGIFWDKKQYYSDGKYFNKSKTNIPPSVDIVDVDGNCNMFEIPVNFRYDFSFSRKGRFFSTAGLSTYIMKKENYTYNAESYGSGWSQQVSYKNSGNDLFSILQLSAGYEYNWGKIGSIRIEPYFKVPLKGVGIGSLPISSAGLEVGITHAFR